MSDLTTQQIDNSLHTAEQKSSDSCTYRHPVSWPHHSCSQMTSLAACETVCQLQAGCLRLSQAIQHYVTVFGRGLSARLKRWSTPTAICGRRHLYCLAYKNTPWRQELFGCWTTAVKQFTRSCTSQTLKKDSLNRLSRYLVEWDCSS